MRKLSYLDCLETKFESSRIKCVKVISYGCFQFNLMFVWGKRRNPSSWPFFGGGGGGIGEQFSVLSVESNLDLLWFSFTALCDWFEILCHLQFSTNHMKTQNQ